MAATPPRLTSSALIAAVMNPAMSSWVAVRRRVDFTPGRSVLVLGATGNAGRMGAQTAPHDILAELSKLVAELAAGTFEVGAQAVRLSDVERAWGSPVSGDDRLVLVP